MRVHLFGLAFVAFMLTLGCSKEEDDHCPGFDWAPLTIFYPGPYLPAYPGSSWTYQDANGNVKVVSTASGYEGRIIDCDLGGCTSNMAFVPIWNGQALYGYSTLYNSHSACFMAPLLKEAPVGTSWNTMYPWQGYSIQRVIIQSDTSMIIRGVNYTDVIGVADNEYNGQFIKTNAWRYYAKDIGIIREDLRKGTDSILTYELVSYSINR